MFVEGGNRSIDGEIHGFNFVFLFGDLFWTDISISIKKVDKNIWDGVRDGFCDWIFKVFKINRVNCFCNLTLQILLEVNSVMKQFQITFMVFSQLIFLMCCCCSRNGESTWMAWPYIREGGDIGVDWWIEDKSKMVMSSPVVICCIEWLLSLTYCGAVVLSLL